MKIDSDEYKKLKDERRLVGEQIDPATAEVACWHADYFDAYRDGLELPDEVAGGVGYGRQHYVRAPGSDFYVFIDDLPEARSEEVWRRINDGYYSNESSDGWWRAVEVRR
jgi:hypothetical protein